VNYIIERLKNQEKVDIQTKKILLSAILYLLTSWLFCQEKKVCITVDDLPTVHYDIEGYSFKYEITNALVKAFVDNQVPAIGYVNESKLYNEGVLDTARVVLLELWLQNRLELGNHTFSHLNYHKVPFEQYTEDILKGEKITRALTDRYQSQLTYFRHPYLRSGASKSRADSLTVFLRNHGYREAPVTIDNEDYLFALAYSRAFSKKDSGLMEKIGEDYLDYMEKKLLYYEAQSHKLFDRKIDQILLIHASYLNANYVDELIQIFQYHGYTFASQAGVLKDAAYDEPVTVFGDWGISWIDRWALSRGKSGDFFKDEPRTPQYILDLVK